MIFNRIIITNLFSYYGKQEFDLSGSSKQNNIAIIYGRNGYGKTSFINSLKLLFCGSDDRSMRQFGYISGFQKSTLGPKEYIAGRLPLWEGIRNKYAVHQGKDDFSISAEWNEKGNNVVAKRSWPLSSNSTAGDLDVYIDGKLITEEATTYLENRLPKELVPYFFFDGELIRELAEASDSQSLMTQHIERLLELRRVIDLQDQCKVVLSEFRKEYADRDILQLELDKKATLSKKLADQNKLSQQEDELNYQLQEIDSKLNKIERELEYIFKSVNFSDEDAIRSQQEEIKKSLESNCQRFVEITTFDILLIANPELPIRVMEHLSDMRSKNHYEQHQTIEKLKRILPEELFGLPPHSIPRLTQNQQRFYANKMSELLNKMTGDIAYNDKWKISPEKLIELSESFPSAISEAKNRQARAAEIIKFIRLEQSNLNDLEEKLIEAGSISQKSRQRYEQLKAERAENEREKGNILQKMGDLSNSLNRANTDIQKLQEELVKIKDKIEFASIGQSKVSLLNQAVKAIDAYRLEMRNRFRNEIQDLVNIHFKELFTSSNMIDQVRLNDDFIPQYIDSKGIEIGRLSISAGTKQLAATAFLWALKEVSKRQVPVIVDTPLARIDRRHQENLLARFYPNVSEQVIILPTDSELDILKYDIIKPHIYKEYKLENPSGLKTIVTEEPMNWKK